ncbi:carboxypeptidase-like regulatory domain-containing protein [Sphingobacteriales bacterium UPWRP_1]|nr:hypothetical protein BVG80_15510 [Sphingobacteriales bacterium TSM_CSM]PSJ72406.1 carboxypeptidase-like regulatory domain-containing protein [Sphingobacteriales bacterium UPWRP_1]
MLKIFTAIFYRFRVGLYLYTLPLLVMLYTMPVQGQELVLSGKVRSAGGGQAVAFANIGINGYAIGTVSNERGEFELHFPEKFAEDSLQVSCIGYYAYAAPIADLLAMEPVQIALVPRAYSLETVTITPNDLSAGEIVKRAMQHIPDNYIVDPYLMDGFYREYFKENGTYAAFAEAAVSIYDPMGYLPNMNKPAETVKVNQLRVSDICNKGKYVLYIDVNFALRGNLLRNSEFWQLFARQTKTGVERLNTDSVMYDGKQPVYCIGYVLESKKSGTYRGRLFIRKTDYAVLRVEIAADNLPDGREGNGAPYRSKAVMTYKEYNGKLYLNYVNASHDVFYYDYETQQRYDLNFYAELTINNISTKGVTPLPENTRAKQSSIFYHPRYRTYDPQYWQTYNLFETSPANIQIIADLERQRPLKEQYAANGKLKYTGNEPYESDYYHEGYRYRH